MYRIVVFALGCVGLGLFPGIAQILTGQSYAQAAMAHQPLPAYQVDKMRKTTRAPITFVQAQPARTLSRSQLDTLLAKGPLPERVMGDADAPLTIIEYASLTCPACRAFHTETLPSLKKDYIDTGKVRIVYRPLILNTLDAAANMLSFCTDAQRYFPLVDTFFEQQQTWVVGENPLGPLSQIAKQAGFTDETFETCLKDQDLLDNLNTIRATAAEFGIESTPSFIINDEIFTGLMPKDDFLELVEKRLP